MFRFILRWWRILLSRCVFCGGELEECHDADNCWRCRECRRVVGQTLSLG